MSTKPAVFISYPRADEGVANKLRTAISFASTEVDVLIDHAMMDSGDDYEREIAQGISRSKWFILLCVGNYITEKDMTWCYYETGQFRAQLNRAGLSGDEISKKMIVIYDASITRTLTRFQAIRINTFKSSSRPFRLPPATPDGVTPAEFLLAAEDTQLFGLLTYMATDKELSNPRNINDSSIRNLVREGVISVIRAFAAASGDGPLDEIPVAPRISFTIGPDDSPPRGLHDETVIISKFNALFQPSATAIVSV